MDNMIFRCDYANGDRMGYVNPCVSWTTAFRTFKYWGDQNHVPGKIYAGDRFVRETGTAWQTPPRAADHLFYLAYNY